MAILEVNLSNPDNSSDTAAMDFQLEDNDFNQRWCRLVDSANKMKPPVHSSWGMHVDDSALGGFVDKLNHAITRFNEYTPSDFLVPLLPANDVSQMRLNEIHDKFDKYYYALDLDNPDPTGRSATSIQAAPYLHQINSLVHNLESIIEVNQYKAEGLVCAWFSARHWEGLTYNYFQEPFQPGDLELFTLEEAFGNIYLNYGRAGKSLFDMYLSDDIALLQSEYRARPAHALTSGIIALFGNYTKDHELELKRFYQWWDENDVSSYGYKKFDPHNTLGYLKLGGLVPNSQIQHLYDPARNRFDEIAVISHYSRFSNVDGFEIRYDSE